MPVIITSDENGNVYWKHVQMYEQANVIGTHIRCTIKEASELITCETVPELYRQAELRGLVRESDLYE